MRWRPVSAGTLEYRPWSPSPWPLILILAATLGIALGLSLSALWPRGAVGADGYSLWKWEANTLLDNVFARVGIGPDPGQSEGEAAVRQYFKLTSQIRAAENTETPDLALIETLTNERGNYENDVERLIEGYITEAVDGAGLQRPLPLFNAKRITWPPVDFELTNPPQLLVRSPRDRIERSGDTLLKNDLSLRDIERLEAKTTNDDTVTVVVSIGGLAAYPAIVRDDRSYDSLLDTASHEWVHHYLAFFPLGEQWGKGGDAETLNETTANIAGREIANLIRAKHPLTLPPGEDGSLQGGQPPTVDFSKEMHDLRVQVDALLADGKVSEAEQLMDQKREYLNQHGIAIRKINQAYFAFYGTYADSPQSTNPIGPKIEQVWEKTQDVGVFLKLMREVRTSADLDRTLAALGQ
ncbi:MAG TPA: hypothetical protein PKI89_12535 [Tepidiformaceae bacterium]|nr:hypothetical protein [Tepidiformaceae bacterium]